MDIIITIRKYCVVKKKNSNSKYWLNCKYEKIDKIKKKYDETSGKSRISDVDIYARNKCKFVFT